MEARHKITYGLTTFIRNIQNTLVHGDGKLTGGCQELEGEGNGERLLDGESVPFRGDENISELDRRDGCTTWWVHYTSLIVHWSSWYLSSCYVNFTLIKKKKKRRDTDFLRKTKPWNSSPGNQHYKREKNVKGSSSGNKSMIPERTGIYTKNRVLEMKNIEVNIKKTFILFLIAQEGNRQSKADIGEIFCKEPRSVYFSVCEPFNLCGNCLTQPSECRSSGWRRPGYWPAVFP